MNTSNTQTALLSRKIDNTLLAAQKNVIENIKRKYMIVRFFINKVISPKKVHCLTEFKYVSHDDLVKNETNNKELLKRYGELYEKLLGINCKVKKDTLDDKIHKDYIIKFIRLCLESIGYVLVKKIVDKEHGISHYTIKVNSNLTIRRE